MKVNRRDFLKWASLSAVGAVACNFFREGEMELQSPVDLPEDLVTGKDNWYATLCQQCPEQEGIVVRVMEGRAKKVQGNPLYPTNRGAQSARCEAGLQALYHPDRLSGPVLREGARGAGTFRPIGWTEAQDMLRSRLQGLRDANNPDALLMVTEPLRGHLGMVVSRFVGSYGGRHLAFEPLEQTVLRASLKQVFGQDRLPSFDIEHSQYLLSFGADFLSTWLSPVQYAREYGKFRDTGNGHHRGALIHVGSRYSMTAANADEWIPVLPGREGILAMSICSVIMEEGLGDPAMAAGMTGAAGAAALADFRPEKVVRPDDPMYAGVPESIRGEPAAELIRRVAREFATRRPSLAIGGGDAGAHTNGLFNLSSAFSLNYLVGSVGRKPGEGGVVFNPEPPIAGLRAAPPANSFNDWLQASEDITSRATKVILVRGANPVHGLPNGAGFRDALIEGDPFVVSFSSFMDDTAMMADLVLPERVYLEEWGDDVPEPGPGFQVFGMQQPVVNPLPDLDPRSFPDLLLSLSEELSVDDGLPNTFQDVLSAGARELFDLQRGSIQAATFNEFWNTLLQQGGWWDEDAVSEDSPPSPPNLAELAGNEATPTFAQPGGGELFYLVPFLSNSLLDGRGAHLPWLQAAPDPLTTVTWGTWIEINARQADEMGYKEGDIVRVVSTEGSIEAVVYVHPAVPPGVVCLPVGEGHNTTMEYATRDGEERGVNPISILAPRTVGGTGALAWAATRVLVQPTTRSTKISKFEGIVPAFPIGTKEEDIVQVTRE